MPKKNVDLMLQVREQALSDPESHHQMGWEYPNGRASCGSTRCIAGWAIFLATGKQLYSYRGGYATAPRYNFDADPLTLGAEALGLTMNEAKRLFLGFDDSKALGILDEYIEQGKNEA